MECPKCHSEVSDNLSVCPSCKKVLQLECPNCHSLGQSSICEKCGYTILVKCSKCSKVNPIDKKKCVKCGFSLKTSLAYQECESDEYAGITVEFENLKAIKKALKTQEMYNKFLLKLKNLLMSQLKNLDGKVISFKNSYMINLNKELSFAASANKAVRLSIKIINSFININAKLINEFGFPFGLKISIVKKTPEELLDYISYDSKVKQLSIKKNEKTYLKGLQIKLDQFVWDYLNKEYKTESLYSIDKDGQSIMFYEIKLDNYILPPEEAQEESIEVIPHQIKKDEEEVVEQNMYSFNVFDINAKCSFQTVSAPNLIEKLKTLNLDSNGKIIALKSEKRLSINTSDIVDFYKKNDYKVLSICCNELLCYDSWGVLCGLFKDYYNLPRHKSFFRIQDIDEKVLQKYKILFNLVMGKSVKAMTHEDARFTYMESFGEFLASLKKTVIIIEGLEYLDDTTIQTLELYFDKYKNIKPNFVFINTSNISLHSKIKSLLRTPLYTEISLQKAPLETILETVESDALDFMNSFYYEKLQENCKGSLLYFENVIEYLKETGVLIEFKNKLIVKTHKSVVVPKDLNALYRARIKNFSKNKDLSFLLAYATLLGGRVDSETLNALGVKDVDKQAKLLQDSKLIRAENQVIHINNFELLEPVVKSAIKKDVEVFLAKNIMAKIGKGLDDTTLVFVLGAIDAYKEEYLTLWKNSQLAIHSGDYDAYLKNCLGFLSLIDKIKANISPEEIEENKKEVYNNILMYLYGYSPEKIYFIENLLLMDAIKENDDEKIIKLSNLMLQGALLSSNYTDALGLLHNIFSRMQNATLLVDGKINSKFLLLSLVKVEILYNIGKYQDCVDVAEEIMSVLSSKTIEQVKPASFSSGLFISHLIETLRLACFAKLYLLNDDIEEFIEKIQVTLDVVFEEKSCILAIRDFLAGKTYITGEIETASSFSKIIYLILQECSLLKEDYKSFAQNIYQAKLLATEIHQKEIELFCDLLIAYAYSKAGVNEKAESIYVDVMQCSEKSAIFNMLLISKYLLAKMRIENFQKEEAMLLINDSLALLQKFDNQSKVLFALFENLFIELFSDKENTAVDIASERRKLSPYVEKLASLISITDELSSEDEIIEN